jgi:hypothetical protein
MRMVDFGNRERLSKFRILVLFLECFKRLSWAWSSSTAIESHEQSTQSTTYKSNYILERLVGSLGYNETSNLEAVAVRFDVSFRRRTQAAKLRGHTSQHII